MSRLNIPRSYQNGIKALLTLDEVKFGALLTGLRQRPEPRGELLRLSEMQIRGFGKEESEPILSAIDSLYRVWSAAGDLPLNQFVEDVSAATASFYPEGESSEAKERFRTVLDVEPIARAAKALAVSTDHQRIFSDAKILTDIRYAFRPTADADPYGATIIHVLKLHFHEDGEHKNFFVALDESDLKKLVEVVERARSKARRLQTDLAKAGVQYLGKEDK